MRRWFVMLAVLSIYPLFAVQARADGQEEMRWMGLGAEYGGPLRGSGEMSFLLDPGEPTFSGFVGTVNVGQGGAKVGLGGFVLWPRDLTFDGLAVQAVCVRTWGSPLGAAADSTFLGGEIEYTGLSLFNIHAGALAPVGGRHLRGSYVFTWGVGVRLPGTLSNP